MKVVNSLKVQTKKTGRDVEFVRNPTSSVDGSLVPIQTSTPAVKIKNQKVIKALFIEFLANPYQNKPSLRKFSSVFGVKLSVLRRWRNSREVGESIKKRVRDLFGGGEAIAEMYRALFAQVIQGDVKAIKLAMEITGEHTPTSKLQLEHSLEEIIGLIEKDKASELS